jgi:sporulation protein YlmC with PRC-barrel domain
MGAVTGRQYDAVLSLLDRQVVDPDGGALAKIDDIELEPGENGELWVSAILSGPAALGPRIGGVLGRVMVGISTRLTGGAAPLRIPFSTVTEIGATVRVGIRDTDLRRESLEGWLREHVIAKIPGATDAPE